MRAFDLTEEQQLFKSTIDRLFAEQYGFEQRRHYAGSASGWSREVWSQLAELGLLGLPFPEEHGGLGAGPAELALVMDTIGRHLALEPYLANVVLAGQLVARLGSPTQQDAYLAPLIVGDRLLALAHDEARDGPGTIAEVVPGGWEITGRKAVVLGGNCADHLVVSAQADGQARLFIVTADAPGVSISPYRLLGGLGAADISFEKVSAKADAQLGASTSGALEDVLASATALLCVEAVGAMEALQTLTVEYLKTRRQFGAPLGSFQALQHRAVDMLVALEQARSMAVLAVAATQTGDPRWRSTAICAAKIQIGRSARFIGQQAIQLHGGIGMTDEYQASHYFRRLTTIEMLFGTTDEHLLQLAATDGLMGKWTRDPVRPDDGQEDAHA